LTRAKRFLEALKQRQKEFNDDPTAWRSALILVDVENLVEAVAELVGDVPEEGSKR
jgi:hypothetical protein